MQFLGEKLVFIYNPAAGSGIRDVEQRLKKKAKLLGLDIIITKSGSLSESEDIINTYFKATNGVFTVIGGDGTINTVGKLILERKGTLGIIPAGSGNGLARYLKIPMNLEKAFEHLIKGKKRDIDVWKINNHVFLNVAGLGFDAEIARLFSKRTNKGFWGYATYVTSTVFGYKSSPFELQVNNTTISGNYFLVAFFNGSQYGNNAVIAPTASASDGLVDLVGVPDMNSLSVINNLYRCMVTRNGLQNALEEKTEKVKVLSNKELPLHVDGEFCGFFDQFKVKKEKEKLSIIA